MTKSERAAAMRAKYKALGLCYYCRTAPFKAGASMCETCSERRRQYILKRQDDLKAAGVCEQCAKRPRIEGQRHCSVCASKHAVNANIAREKFRGLGICPTCRKGQLSTDGRGGASRCPVCYAKEQARSKRNYAAVRAAGLCSQCFKVPATEGKTSCADCRRRALLGRFEAQGLTETILDGLKYECGICGKNEDLHLDHDHFTNAVRQWLCSHCNHGIGHFFEDTTLLFKAMGYIERHRKLPFSAQFYRGSKWTKTEPPLPN